MSLRIAENCGMENGSLLPAAPAPRSSSSEVLARLDQILAVLERIAASLPLAAPATLPGGARQTRGKPDAPEALPADGGPATPSSSVTLIPDAIARLLDSRNVRVRGVPAPSPADPLLGRLALFLASRYHHLRPVLDRIKRTMQTGGAWHYKMAGRPPEEIASCCQFCHHLHGIAYLSEYRYHRSPRCLIEGRSSTAPEAQNFFSGQWLERAIRQQLSLLAAQDGLEISMLANAQVVLPNQNDFELDLLASIGGVLLWIECKTADYQSYVRKYSRVARMLNLGKEHSILVLTDVAPTVCTHLSDLFDMTVMPPHGLLSHVRSLLGVRQLGCAV